MASSEQPASIQSGADGSSIHTQARKVKGGVPMIHTFNPTSGHFSWRPDSQGLRYVVVGYRQWCYSSMIFDCGFFNSRCDRIDQWGIWKFRADHLPMGRANSTFLCTLSAQLYRRTRPDSNSGRKRYTMCMSYGHKVALNKSLSVLPCVRLECQSIEMRR